MISISPGVITPLSSCITLIIAYHRISEYLRTRSWRRRRSIGARADGGQPLTTRLPLERVRQRGPATLVPDQFCHWPRLMSQGQKSAVTRNMMALNRNLIASALTGAMALATILAPAVASADTWTGRWERVPRQTVTYVHGRRIVRRTYHWIRHRIRIPTDEAARHTHHRNPSDEPDQVRHHDNGHHYGQLKHHRGRGHED